MSTKEVPKALRIWFVIHFVLDLLFAIPLFFVPSQFLNLLGWKIVDPITTRMVGAALFAIGIESLISRNSSYESFKTMLALKIIWSFSALAGLITGLLKGLFEYQMVGIFLSLIFLLFNIIWTYWFVKIK